MAEAEDESTSSVIDEEDFYTFLNVPRDATPEQIHQAYRRFSRLYHPDKHVDPARKKEAELLFHKSKLAYEVLSDPMQRAVYDNLGLKGLEGMMAGGGWEVMQRTMTPQEIREEYERLAREREEKRLNLLTNPEGTVTVRINATDLFSNYSDGYLFSSYSDGQVMDHSESGVLPNIEVSGMSFSQSIDAPLTVRDTATLAGRLSTHNGTGSGSLSFSIRRLLRSQGQVELAVALGNGPVYSIKGHHTLSKYTFCDVATSMQFDPQGVNLGYVAGIGCRLDDNVLGYLRFRGGMEESSMSTVLEYKGEKHQVSFTIQLGIPNTHLALAYKRKFLDDTLRLRISAKYGTLGASINYGADKVVSKHNTIGASVSFGIPTGVLLTLKLVRANQVYMFPIHLCEEVLPAPVFYATLAPLVTWIVVKKLVVDPIKKDQEERDREKQRKMKKSQMEQKYREAQAAVNLMSAQYGRVRSEEEARRGLVIVQATYGRLLSSSGSTTVDSGYQSEAIDVTIPLQCLVKDSKLVLHEPSKCQLPGFFDPCVGEDKQLMVQYLFHNQMHEVTIADTDVLRIPKTWALLCNRDFPVISKSQKVSW